MFIQSEKEGDRKMEIKMDAWMRWNGRGMTELSKEINYAAVKEVSKHKQTGRKNMCCDDEDGLRSGLEMFRPHSVCSLIQ